MKWYGDWFSSRSGLRTTDTLLQSSHKLVHHFISKFPLMCATLKIHDKLTYNKTRLRFSKGQCDSGCKRIFWKWVEPASQASKCYCLKGPFSSSVLNFFSDFSLIYISRVFSRNAKEGATRTNSKSDSLRYEYDDHYFMTDPQVTTLFCWLS